MIKRPFCVCVFDDKRHRVNEDLTKSLDGIGYLFDIFLGRSHVEPINRELNRHIVSVTVNDVFTGHDDAQIVLDNEGSKFTSRMFDKVLEKYSDNVFPLTQPESATEKEANVKDGYERYFILAEGLAVSIYIGYLTRIGDVSRIKLRLRGQIVAMGFSYNQQGTPNITLMAQDRFTFMGNPRLHNSRLTLGMPSEKEEAEPIPLQNYYHSRKLKDEYDKEIGKKPTSSASRTRRGAIDQARGTTQGMTLKDKPTSTVQKKWTTKTEKYVGLRDSQVIPMVVNEYNKRVTAIYGEEFSIQGLFIAMTGEGGATYYKSTCHDPRVIKNRVVQKLSVGYSDFLQHLAGRHNFDCFVKNRVLFFIPPVIKGTPDFIYAYGKGQQESYNMDGKILSFTPKLNFIQLGTDYYAMEFDEEHGLVNFIKSNIIESLQEKGQVEQLERVVTYLWHISHTEGNESLRKQILELAPNEKSIKKFLKETDGKFIINHFFGNALEEFIKSLTQTQADILQSQIVTEGNEKFNPGLTIQCIGFGEEGKIGERFDGNYRINKVTHEYRSSGYTCRLECSARAIQGVSFIGGKFSPKRKTTNEEGKPSIEGLFRNKIYLEPSLIWKKTDSMAFRSMARMLKGTPEGEKEFNALKDNITGAVGNAQHTFDADVEFFDTLLDKFPRGMLSVENALEVMMGGEPDIENVSMRVKPFSEMESIPT